MQNDTPTPPTLSRDAQEVILKLHGCAADLRRPWPDDEKVSDILAKLHDEGLARLAINANHRLTAAGEEIAGAVRDYRRAELDGLPLDLWRPEHNPDPLLPDKFREEAIFRTTGPDAAPYHANEYLMLRGRHPDLPHETLQERPATQILDKDL